MTRPPSSDQRLDAEALINALRRSLSSDDRRYGASTADICEILGISPHSLTIWRRRGIRADVADQICAQRGWRREDFWTVAEINAADDAIDLAERHRRRIERDQLNRARRTQ